MGYTHGRKWTEEDLIREIIDLVSILKIDHFPTHNEIIKFHGNYSLAMKISKSGGSRHYADLLGLKMVDCESELGNYFEELCIEDILINTGLSSLHTKARYPYDVLTNGNIKVDVKASRKIYRKGSKFPYYSFNLEKKEPTCDIFVFYCLNDEKQVEKTVIVPSCLLSGKTQVGMGRLSKWDAYIDKWEYFKIYDDFYNSVKGSAVNLPRRRSENSLD